MDQNDMDFKAWNLGSKLCFGFEILANSKVHQDELKQAYIQSLTNKGYFQSELKGSKKYKSLLEEAQKHFLQMAQSYGKCFKYIINYVGCKAGDMFLPKFFILLIVLDLASGSALRPKSKFGLHLRLKAP